MKGIYQSVGAGPCLEELVPVSTTLSVHRGTPIEVCHALTPGSAGNTVFVVAFTGRTFSLFLHIYRSHTRKYTCYEDILPTYLYLVLTHAHFSGFGTVDCFMQHDSITKRCSTIVLQKSHT